jgi:hypothetical protein
VEVESTTRSAKECVAGFEDREGPFIVMARHRFVVWEKWLPLFAAAR